MKRLINILLPRYSGQTVESITINGREQCLVHEVYTWFGFSFVGESILYQSVSDALNQIRKS